MDNAVMTTDGYLDVDREQIFSICETDIPALIGAVRAMIEDLNSALS